MRMRFKPYARPELAAWPYFVDAPCENRERWHAAFARAQQPMRLELGCGKGGFLARIALRDAECNFLGVDIKSEMLVVGKRNIERLYAEAGRPIENVLLAAREIEDIEDMLAPQDVVDRIYINFCNPWYKTSDAKHRLTHPRQLVKYRGFLRQDGEIWFKTDDGPLFEDSLRYFGYTGFAVEWLTRDLHADEPVWNIRTEHEEMFAREGKTIKACIARMHPAQLDKAEILKLKNI